MNTFFAHHNAVHNSGNRALLIVTVSVCVLAGVVVFVAKKGGGK